MKKYIFLISVFLILLWFESDILPKDINVDYIYINQESEHYSKLLQKKLDVYGAVNSRFIDRNVIFTGWLNGFDILYIKELPATNVIYRYNRRNRKRDEIARIKGTITGLKTSSNGRYCFLSLLKIVKGRPLGEIVFLNIPARRMKSIKDTPPFTNFTLSPSGNSILYESPSGIIEHYPESNIKKNIIKRSQYSTLVRPGASTLAYVSPNRRKSVILSGSAGFYNARFVSSEKKYRIKGITSATEFYWLDNNHVVYRKGGVGNFSVAYFNVKTRRTRTLIRNSFNTNIIYSKFPRILSFLKDQLIYLYDVRENKTVVTGLEGEDVEFSPDGSRFSSLLLKKLFITNYNIVIRKNMEVKKISRDIMGLYKKVKSTRKVWLNSYSLSYINRKISIYSKISR